MGIRDILFPWRVIKDLRKALKNSHIAIHKLTKEINNKDRIIYGLCPNYDRIKYWQENLDKVHQIKKETIAHLNEDLSSHDGKYTQEFLEAKMAEAGLGNYPKYHFNPQLEAEPEKYDF